MINKTFILKVGNIIFVLFIVACGVAFYLQNNPHNVNRLKKTNGEMHFQDVSNVEPLNNSFALYINLSLISSIVYLVLIFSPS